MINEPTDFPKEKKENIEEINSTEKRNKMSLRIFTKLRISDNSTQCRFAKCSYECH